MVGQLSIHNGCYDELCGPEGGKSRCETADSTDGVVHVLELSRHTHRDVSERNQARNDGQQTQLVRL